MMMTLHCRNGISHETERHVFIWRALMFEEATNIPFTIACLQRVQHIEIVQAQVVFNERT